MHEWDSAWGRFDRFLPKEDTMKRNGVEAARPFLIARTQSGAIVRKREVSEGDVYRTSALHNAYAFIED